MNNIRRISLGAIVALFSVAPSFATLWTGTITETVISTNHPGYAVGDIYTGTYQYESDSIDGDFGTTAYFVGHHESSVGTLFTVLYDFAPLPGRDAWIRGSDGTFASQQHMIVENGEVVFFNCEGEIAYTDFGFTFENGVGIFGGSSGGYGGDPGGSTSGTLSFSAPTVANIPESTGTAFLMTMGALTTFIARRRKIQGKVCMAN